MSKWTVMVVLGTTFAAGLGGGWLLTGGISSFGRGPALAATVPEPYTSGPVLVPSVLPSRSPSSSTTSVKAVPTPGSYFRLGASDTLSEISRKAYGTTKRVSDLQRANPSLEPKNLKSGTLIYVPSGREPTPAPPSDVIRPTGSAGKASGPTASR